MEEFAVVNDNSNSCLMIPKFDYAGIKRIEIPKQDEDFRSNDYGLSILKKYLPQCINTHKKNAEKINYLYNYFLGSQDIITKERLYKKDSQNNNKIVENHANRQVNFKVGFLTGEQRDYTLKSGTKNDDMEYLSRYLTDCNFFSKDKTVKEWIYATGIGVSYIVPRTDIIITEGKTTKYKTKENGFDIDNEAPFEYEAVSPIENFVVYSSGFNKRPLFCVSIIQIDVSKNDEEPQYQKEIHIETRYASFVFRSDLDYAQYFFEYDNILHSNPKVVHYLPLVEQSINNSRMGIVELNRTLFNSINTIKSSIADMIVDNANVILVFKRVDIDADQIEKMKEAGAIIIPPQDGVEGDLDKLTIEIPFEGLNNYYEQTLQQAYDIAGVPLASGQVTSGGDTGQARLLGSGWNNAYIVINNDITSLKGYDYDILKMILQFSKLVPNCPLNETNASQIDINYRVNQNDNFLVKTQGMSNLYNMNMPLEFILKAGKLSNDVKTDAKDWQQRIDEVNKQNQEMTKQPQNDNNDNNSQE